MKIKVLKAKNRKHWHAILIGSVVEVIETINAIGYYVKCPEDHPCYNIHYDHKNYGWVPFKDCEIVE